MTIFNAALQALKSTDDKQKKIWYDFLEKSL